MLFILYQISYQTLFYNLNLDSTSWGILLVEIILGKVTTWTLNYELLKICFNWCLIYHVQSHHNITLIRNWLTCYCTAPGHLIFQAHHNPCRYRNKNIMNKSINWVHYAISRAVAVWRLLPLEHFLLTHLFNIICNEKSFLQLYCFDMCFSQS